MRRGDVVHVELPPPAGAAGHEQHGRRFAIVVQANQFNVNPKTVQIVPTTANPAGIRFPGAVGITPSAANQLPKESIALVHQTRAADVNRINEVVGRLDEGDLVRIDDGLRLVFGL